MNLLDNNLSAGDMERPRSGAVKWRLGRLLFYLGCLVLWLVMIALLAEFWVRTRPSPVFQAPAHPVQMQDARRGSSNRSMRDTARIGPFPKFPSWLRLPKPMNGNGTRWHARAANGY